MSFNVSKCHVLSVTNKHNPIQHTYSLHQQPLERVHSTKYLGVEISSDLNWGKHIESVSAKANRTSAFIYRNLRGCPEAVHSHCFKSLARPLLEYASPVWDPHQANHINTLEAVQRRAARRITRDFRPTSSATALVARLNLQPLQERRHIDKAAMLYKIVNGLVNFVPPPNILIPKTRQLRCHQYGFHTLQTRVDAHLHSFFPSAIRLWNNLPADTVNSPNLSNFKSTYGRHLKQNKNP